MVCGWREAVAHQLGEPEQSRRYHAGRQTVVSRD